MRAARALGGALALSVALGARARAADSPSPADAAGLERRKIQPVAEHRVEGASRNTLDTQARERQRTKRNGRMGMQIPAALRQRAQARVEARITQNLARAKELRKVALGMLGKLLSELPPDATELPETLMRLGELEWEDSREVFLERFAQWEKTPTDQRGEPPVPDYSRSRGRFKQVLEQHPEFSRYDLALYVDGFLATEEAETEQALERFNRILAQYPSSPFVPDAHMVRAEAEFAKANPNYEFAYREYEAVLAYPDTELHDLALFKSAWALWRLGQTDEAARRFLIVFKTSSQRSNAPRLGRHADELDQLQAEALRNLVAVFVEDEKNTAEDMHRFLVRAGGEQFAGEIVRALAEALYDQSHYQRGIEAYRLLLKIQPTDEHAYEYALAIANGHSTLEMWDELQQDYRSMLNEYVAPAAARGAEPAAGNGAPPASPGQGSGAWLQLQDAATRAAAAGAIEKALYNDAVGLHAKAQADKSSKVEFEATAALYDVYLTRFGTGPRAYEVYFNLGEVHFHHLVRAIPAADAYLAAVRLKPDGPWSHDALYNALAALEAAREEEFQAAKRAGEKPRETPTDKKLTEAMELYASTYPNDPDLPEMLFRQGRLYYDYQVYDPAVRQWGLLLEKHPNSSYARGAGELILDSFNKSQDYQNIETWGRRLLTAPAFAGPSGQARLQNLIVQAIFKQGEQLSASGAHGESAAAYLRAANEFPKDERAAQAGVNAVIEGEKAVDLPRVREAAALLDEKYRARPEAAKGIWIAASLHQSLGLLAEAAGYHEALAAHWPKDERHQDAAYNAVLLRTSLGQREQAVQDGEHFQRRYPSGPTTDEVTFLMGKAHEQAEDWRSARNLYLRYAGSAKLPSRRIEALVRLAVACVELNDDKGARDALERAVKEHKTSFRSLDDRGKYFGARAHFLQAQRTLAEFEQIKIEGDVKQLGQRLKRKAELLKKASSALLDTAKLGVAEWTTASLYQVGFIYEAFAKSLSGSPPPANLSAEQADEYRQQIDEFVVPIEEKSIEAYESGWLKARELGIYNSWTAKMREALGRLNSEMYPPLTEVGFRLRSEGAQKLPDLIPTTRRTETGASREFFMGKPAQDAPAGPPASQHAGSNDSRVSRAGKP
ncbi:MAG TPA: tetratricopeptide repeat protein [Polyangiaceae bacterium]|nr:tetratricopeptide repeat protein [Polyangiaceae bacterium]